MLVFNFIYTTLKYMIFFFFFMRPIDWYVNILYILFFISTSSYTLRKYWYAYQSKKEFDPTVARIYSVRRKRENKGER